VAPSHCRTIEATLWCAKIGLGSDTTPADRCERGMQSSRHEWNKRTLTADEAYEISLGDVLFAAPSAPLYAEISLNVTYTPWVLPYHLNKEIGFYSSAERKRGNRAATQTVGVERRIIDVLENWAALPRAHLFLHAVVVGSLSNRVEFQSRPCTSCSRAFRSFGPVSCKTIPSSNFCGNFGNCIE
jgi:hypothetical protein